MNEQNFELQSTPALSVWGLFSRFRVQVIVTWSLVFAESGLVLLLPLLMGIAIDDLLESKMAGLFWLATVGSLIVAAGAARRFYDTRIYSKVYVQVAGEVVEREKGRQSDVSKITARTNMVSELIEFLEGSFPMMVNCLIGLVGTLLIILTIELNVFSGCLIATVLITILFALTSKRTFRLNQGYNDEWEKRVDVLGGGDSESIGDHFRRSMRWNIRLSDLETVNYSISWFIMIGLLVFSVWATVQDGSLSRGRILAVLLYVFEYIECVVAIPLFYQQYVRLQEITSRLTPDMDQDADQESVPGIQSK